MRHPYVYFAALVFAATLSAGPSHGQVDQSRGNPAFADVVINAPTDCRSLAREESGVQWIVGENVTIYKRLRGELLETRAQSYEKVSCFYSQDFDGTVRVLVANEARDFCGWIDKGDLLSENLLQSQRLFGDTGKLVCEIPRALSFSTYCQKLEEMGHGRTGACAGNTPNLRTKAVLTGSTAEVAGFPFLTAPKRARADELVARSFFSFLEVHDVQPGDNGQPMLLIGDGDGLLFGFLDQRAVELWPTRLGLFYDTSGQGVMFQTSGDLIQNWRTGAPEPQITSRLDSVETGEFIHGNLPLLSYPIMATRDLAREATGSPDDPAYHQVVFLGQSGEGSASELLNQAEFSRRLASLKRLNVMVVADTTESMRDYLPPLQRGISAFITNYLRRRSDETQQLPDLAIGFYAYSDFSDAGRTGLTDPLVTAEVMAPVRVLPGFNMRPRLASIEAHEGLDDPVGLREEAAFEAVLQLSAGFENEAKGWYADGPRVIIHIADHGSRSSVDIAAITQQLQASNVFYLPIAVLTDDQNDSSRTRGRQAFMRQAIQALAASADAAAEEDVNTIDFRQRENQTSANVEGRLNLVINEVARAVLGIRQELAGEDIVNSSLLAQDRAASRIKIDDRLIEQFGVEDVREQVIVEASTGFAPLSIKSRGLIRDIDWTYTVAMEPIQAVYLRRAVEEMCAAAGTEQQSDTFRLAILRLAEAFSGDTMVTDAQIRGVLRDLRDLPGSSDSFLALDVEQIIRLANSQLPEDVDRLRKDVCWISFHMGNASNGRYVRPEQTRWAGSGYTLKPGEQDTLREYIYRPVIGADLTILPSFFFVRPTEIAETETQSGTCTFFCD